MLKNRYHGFLHREIQYRNSAVFRLCVLRNEVGVVLEAFAKHVKTRVFSADPIRHSSPEIVRYMANSIYSERISPLLYPVQVTVDQIFLYVRMVLVQIGQLN